MVRIKKAREINFKYNLKVYWEFLRKYQFLFWTIIFVVLVSAITHLVDKFLFKVIVDRGTEFSAGMLGREAFVSILLGVMIAYAVVMLIRTGCKWIQIYLMNRLDTNIVFDLKTKFFNHIIGLSHKFHTTHKTGSMISRLSRGGSAIERINDFFIFNTIPLIFQLILVGGSLMFFDLMTGVVVALTTFVFITFSIYMQNIQKKANLEFNNAEDMEKANIGDFLTNVDSIKYFGKENIIKSRYRKLNDKTRKTGVKYFDYYRVLDAGHTFIIAVGTFLLILFPLLRFLDGEISIGTVVFIYTAYTNLFGPLYGFVNGMRGFYRSMSDFESLFQYAKIENEIKDKTSAENLVIKDGNVEFRDISFNYGKRKLFEKFNLKINKNEKVALVGHSGCGKTTLLKLIYRLYDVDAGKILIDGNDIKDFKQESLRNELSIVPQECVLFDDTIYNNIAFSNPSASKEEVFRAMKFAQLDEVIQNFPKKEKTIVGERGVRLSGGEKQRVSIARAILANKKILVLDEATSSLDSKTEHQIQKDLERLMQGRTSIIIAHRLSTIMKADKIIVMDNGQIVQVGKHNNLIRQNGLYRELWELQRGGYLSSKELLNPDDIE
ncbi:hypothetical protein COU60_02265 [Candidatus Pacearchaeota archaeon CG10_big_fil_rev_8_21_14_0_10_34_76]|nr:MAG: hypothetical protein COU60_02265 [Candidatus Pacearchaeota archaeon CG10_big_fil_rev_8_21_14_0_10_34_76]